MNGLLRRVVTAAIFVLIMLAGLFGGPYPFVVLFSAITGLCLWEYLSMVLTRDSNRDRIRKVIGLIMGVLPVLVSAAVHLDMVQDQETFVLFVALLFSPFIFMAFIFELFTKSEQPFANIAYIMLGIIYIGVPFALLHFIAFDQDHNFYASSVFGLLLLTWLNDTGAYLIGSAFGKRLLMPRISPKKTWEGMIGGLLITYLTGIVLYYTLHTHSLFDWLMLATIISIFAPLGDLIESMLKRSQDIKDSGSLLPGHGGLLDRFDGFIFSLPFATAYILLVR